MRRRDSIKLMGGALGLSMLRRGRAFDPATNPRQQTFFVAGVRFQPRSKVATGDPVRLVAATVGSEPCYEVRCGEARLGYVPKTLLSALNGKAQLAATLSLVDRDAVPWKRYRVSVLI